MKFQYFIIFKLWLKVLLFSVVYFFLLLNTVILTLCIVVKFVHNFTFRTHFIQILDWYIWWGYWVLYRPSHITVTWYIGRQHITGLTIQYFKIHVFSINFKFKDIHVALNKCQNCNARYLITISCLFTKNHGNRWEHGHINMRNMIQLAISYSVIIATSYLVT